VFCWECGLFGLWLIFLLLLVSIISVSEIVRFPLKRLLAKLVFRKKKNRSCVFVC